jgi:arachidonate 15-lipoxygenase
LISLVCSAPGGMYQPPPTRSSPPVSPLAWLPPLDVALYQVSFLYLLSMVQYDTLGVYNTDPRTPYFADPRVNDIVADFQGDLAIAEITIRKRNRSRPVPYMFQLPSMIPNGISI